MEPFRDGNARDETGAIPSHIRAEVEARDGGFCRVCGGVPESPALHHIRYRSEGGLNVVENLITVHWMYHPRCHEVVHSRKSLWQPILLEVVKHGGVTALQYKRWLEAEKRKRK